MYAEALEIVFNACLTAHMRLDQMAGQTALALPAHIASY